MKNLAFTAGALLLASGAIADPVSSPGVVACVKVNDAGAVSDAFIIVSSGNAEDDRALLSGVYRLKWDPAKPGEERFRNHWIPMAFALGGKKPPKGPQTCAPPNS